MAIFDDPAVTFDSEAVTFDQPSIRFWRTGTRLVRDASGRLVICDDCPCPEDTGTGTTFPCGGCNFPEVLPVWFFPLPSTDSHPDGIFTYGKMPNCACVDFYDDNMFLTYDPVEDEWVGDFPCDMQTGTGDAPGSGTTGYPTLRVQVFCSAANSVTMRVSLYDNDPADSVYIESTRSSGESGFDCRCLAFPTVGGGGDLVHRQHRGRVPQLRPMVPGLPVGVLRLVRMGRRLRVLRGRLL